jgi:hypothetical protein
MTHGRLLFGAVLVAGFAGACSSKAGTPTGAGGSSGTTGSGPVQLVSDPGCGSIDLVVANETLYWTEKAKGLVSSIPVAGGTAAPVAMAQAMPGPIAVDQAAVYWGNDGDKTVMKRPLPTGAAAIFVTANADVVNALLVDSGTLYVGRGLSAQKVATSGGMPTTIMTSPPDDMGLPGAFALDATHLYQTEINHQAVSRETLDGTQNGLLGDRMTHVMLAPDRIAVSQGELVLDAIAVLSGNVIWADGSSIKSKPVGADELMSFTVIANDAGFNPISGFVVSGGKVYLGESSDNNVEVVPVSSPGDAGAPTATVIAMNQMNPSQFAADATAIYWRTADCKIMKLAK